MHNFYSFSENERLSLFNSYFLFKVALEEEEVEVGASEEEEEVVDSEVSRRI